MGFFRYLIHTKWVGPAWAVFLLLLILVLALVWVIWYIPLLIVQLPLQLLFYLGA